MGVAKHHPVFPFRDRCEHRALPDYFKHGCFHHHVGPPDTPSGVFAFVLVLLFQQTAGIYIQMLGEPVYRHIRLNRLGQLRRTPFPFAVLGGDDLCHGFQYRVRGLLSKLSSAGCFLVWWTIRMQTPCLASVRHSSSSTAAS